MIRAVLVLESTGLKTSHLLILTSTDESDCRAVWASGIGPSGVSAQATKPDSKAMNANEVPSIILLRLRTSFCPSCGTAARKCTTLTCSQVEVGIWSHSLITAHATLHTSGTRLLTPLIPHKLVPRFVTQLESGCLVKNYNMPLSEKAQLNPFLPQTRTLNGRSFVLLRHRNPHLSIAQVAIL